MMTTSPIPDSETENATASKRDWLAVWFAMILPTIVTLVYFQWLRHAESSLQQTAMGIGKVVQFGFPLAFVWLFHRYKLRKNKLGMSRPGTEAADLTSANSAPPSWLIGVGFGFLVVATMLVVYFLFIANQPVGETLKALVSGKVMSIGANTPLKFVALGIFYALCHSFLEEYYWRWFVFDILDKFHSTWVANIVSSLGFMAHHVVVLGFFFGWDSPLAYLLSISVAIGGVVWAWLYRRERSLRSCWISHMIVDAGIFSLGYFMIF